MELRIGTTGHLRYGIVQKLTFARFLASFDFRFFQHYRSKRSFDTLEMGFLFYSQEQTSVRLRCRLRCRPPLQCSEAKPTDKYLASAMHSVGDRIIKRLKCREQASFNYFGESAKMTAALGPAH
jgi:hypothetical protein